MEQCYSSSFSSPRVLASSSAMVYIGFQQNMMNCVYNYIQTKKETGNERRENRREKERKMKCIHREKKTKFISVTPFLVQFPIVGTIRKSLVQHPILNDEHVAICRYGARIDYIFHCKHSASDCSINKKKKKERFEKQIRVINSQCPLLF